LSSSSQTIAPPSSSSLNRWLKALALAIVLLIAVVFVLRYVFHYYLHYNEATFTDPVIGAANYWRMRGWLLLHITSGMVALLIGPWQFSRRLRQRYLQLHRVSGRVYVIAVLFGCAAAFRLAAGTTFGKAWGFTLAGLAFAWATTTAMAYYAVRQRQISIHKEWMIRSYVVTFAFVTFRVLNDFPPMMNWLPESDRSVTYGWACWAIPLLITEVILQLARMRRVTPNGVRAQRGVTHS
jgi:heme/copper-type cytochrome/quinol oxidase subunit 3